MALGGFLTPTPNVRLLIVWALVVAKVFVTSVILPRLRQTARIAYGIEWLATSGITFSSPSQDSFGPLQGGFVSDEVKVARHLPVQGPEEVRLLRVVNVKSSLSSL
jgi:hypothetical protein